MIDDQTDNTEQRWQKTPVANLVRHVQSGNYYARIRVRGKLIWKTLKTDRISVAKLRLSDFHKEERQRADAHKAVARGKMTFGQALETYRERLKGDQSLKGAQQDLPGGTHRRPAQIVARPGANRRGPNLQSRLPRLGGPVRAEGQPIGFQQHRRHAQAGSGLGR